MIRIRNFIFAHKAGMRKIVHALQLLVIVAVLSGSGAVGGYWLAANQAKDDRLAQRADHLAEIARLQEAYRRNLQTTGEIVKSAATTAEAAATTAEVATSNAADATRLASKATTAAKQAVTTARSDNVPQPTRAQINRAVESANRQIAK